MEKFSSWIIERSSSRNYYRISFFFYNGLIFTIPNGFFKNRKNKMIKKILIWFCKLIFLFSTMYLIERTFIFLKSFRLEL
ncbi:hypothetical protein AOE57_00135 [Candidatus Riesia pediculicola]|nr:hypothetical protein AOE57_00135 [Candidatus Riesia pediculicola]